MYTGFPGSATSLTLFQHSRIPKLRDLTCGPNKQSKAKFSRSLQSQCSESHDEELTVDSVPFPTSPREQPASGFEGMPSFLANQYTGITLGLSNLACH